LGVGPVDKKTRVMGYRAEKEVWLYLQHVDTIHQRDRRTGDSKDRAYA